MKKVFILVSVIAMGVLICSQCKKDKLIPVTTASEKARTLYNQAISAYDDAYYTKFCDLTVKALQEDPDFFMANYQMAIYSLYYNDPNRFREYGKRAESGKAILSKGEIIMKDAISLLLKKSDSDARPFGEKLVRLYPEDVRAYYQLFNYQRLFRDGAGEERTLKKAIEISENPAPLYNWLGYLYMRLNKYDDALVAFNKYVELKPNLPNAYDSKGEYYMKVKDYEKAYENFMKANSIDSTFSLSKAMNAKTAIDSLVVAKKNQ